MPARRELEPPPGLVAERFELGDQNFAILSWPTVVSDADLTLPAAEREVLELLAAGLSNAEIARRRGRSVRTIANQVASIFKRLGVRSRLELYALLAGTSRHAG